ncbi:hypothetical protein NPIL_244111 [Nephila pilipes]|uniref:Uncharacterized protein n=1 Tax=Nephila pilipes TaxID=299642 RepID=A0A8X6QFF6_NEPPI|nr:hypothetical protein NPIL_244111 [Nephila pilipes]
MWPGWVPGSGHVVRSWEKGAFSGKVFGGSGGRRKRRCCSGILKSQGYLRGKDLVFKLGLNYCDIFPTPVALRTKLWTTRRAGEGLRTNVLHF